MIVNYPVTGDTVISHNFIPYAASKTGDWVHQVPTPPVHEFAKYLVGDDGCDPASVVQA